MGADRPIGGVPYYYSSVARREWAVDKSGAGRPHQAEGGELFGILSCGARAAVTQLLSCAQRQDSFDLGERGLLFAVVPREFQPYALVFVNQVQFVLNSKVRESALAINFPPFHTLVLLLHIPP